MNADDLHMLHGRIGKAVWFVQLVDDALVTYITIRRDIGKPGAVSKAEAAQLLAKRRAGTLGTSLRLAHDAGILSAPLREGLDTFKAERDWLVHRCVHECADDVNDSDKRGAFVRRVDAISQCARELQRAIYDECERYVVSHGVSRSWIHARAERECAK